MSEVFQSSEQLLQLIALLSAELLILIATMAIALGVAKLIYSNVLQRTKAGGLQDKIKHSWHVLKMSILLVTVLGGMSIIAINGWLAWQQQSPLDATLAWLNNIPQDIWLTLAYAFTKAIVGAIAAHLLVKFIHRGLVSAQLRLNQFGHLREDNEQISRFFTGLSHVLTTSVWLLFAVYLTRVLSLPEYLQALLLKLVTIYLIVGVGVVSVRMVTMIVATIHSLSSSYAQSKAWHDYYAALEPLVPLLRKSLQYIIWIATITLVIIQLNPIAEFAKYGPRLIQSIGIFFFARVFIDAGNLLIERSPSDVKEDELAMRRRVTILPLMKTLFRYATYFVTLVLILGTLGVDIMPFLAGAGVLGVVVGFGAQPFINDIVSGFFILFENIFLVDDVIDTGAVLGRVEQIDFRTTKIRDPDGNLHIIRNGDLNHIKNYSKDFTFAVVEVRAGYEIDVKQIREVLTQCGEKIKTLLPEFVTGDLVIAGIVEFEPSAMRFRTTLPVKPAKHFVVATQLREIIKEAFDEKGWEMPSNKQQISLMESSATA